MVDAVSSGSAAQAANLQSQIGTEVLKAKIDADRSVLQIVQPAQNSTPSSANLGAGVGGKVNKSA